jgi:hypothetical protein
VELNAMRLPIRDLAALIAVSRMMAQTDCESIEEDAYGRVRGDAGRIESDSRAACWGTGGVEGILDALDREEVVSLNRIRLNPQAALARIRSTWIPMR